MIACWLKFSERKASPPGGEDPISALYLSTRKYVKKLPHHRGVTAG